MQIMPAMGRVRVHLFWDGETERWDYPVPELCGTGVVYKLADDALRRAADAIAFALEGVGETPEPGEEVTYLPVADGA